MKPIQIVVRTTGGEIKSSVEQATERDYEALKAKIKDSSYLEFDPDEGWALIPGQQILYVEVRLV